MGRPGASSKVGLFAVAMILLVLATSRISLVPTGYDVIPSLAPSFPKPTGDVVNPGQHQTRTPGGGWISDKQNNAAVRRIFVVGCGHSGTSLLFRSIGNMRGVRCLKKETALFVKNTEGDERLRNVMADWDGLTRKGGFSAWVEKTPRHVYYIKKMLELDPNTNNTRIIFIHRDGRDVAISFQARGYSIEKAVNRWVEDNKAALPYVESGAALSVSFEELTSSKTVLSVLRKVAAFLELPMTDSELSLTLLPGTKERAYQEYCTAYSNDNEKFADLAASLVDILAGKEAPKTMNPSSEDLETDLSAKMIEHNSFRTWQMAQAWAEVPMPTQRNWTWEDERYFFNREDAKSLMRQFGYPDEVVRSG